MEFQPTRIPDVILLRPRVFADDRGFFLESWQRRKFAEAGFACEFVQDNRSRSVRNTLRGLHYQIQQPQGKLMSVTRGTIFDVAVDLRKSSATFGHWVAETLSDQNHHQLWVPPGFGHGFLVLSEVADVSYKCTDYYAPEHERCVRWDDPALDIPWPLAPGTLPLVSTRDAAGMTLDRAELFA
ncbi:MAG TPA: dTDP-4-dehydrorhamnose 3,5-epimerase [Steroidobacteraceae bacterium]|nr:dTDP-4-dehydrorhamnose 3,5-epimerase [Steroidobacteraceae bacterium]